MLKPQTHVYYKTKYHRQDYICKRRGGGGPKECIASPGLVIVRVINVPAPVSPNGVELQFLFIDQNRARAKKQKWMPL